MASRHIGWLLRLKEGIFELRWLVDCSFFFAIRSASQLRLAPAAEAARPVE